VIEQIDQLIEEIEHHWCAKRLLVVGDVMLDKYIWGDVRRISPEAPVPVVHATHKSHQPGGAANVAMNLARLGAKTQVIGYTGGDEDERLLLECLRSNGIVSRCVLSEDFPTVTKLRIVGGRQQMLRLDSERLDARPKRDQDRLIEAVLAELPGCDAVVLSDYAKGALTQEVCQTVIAQARKLEIPVLVDPKNADFTLYRGASTICPNLGEFSRAANLDTHDINTLLDAAEEMVTRLGIDFLALTLSDKGIALVRPGSRILSPAVARQVFDVSGAGDSVVAVLALSLASGFTPEVAVRLANLAAGEVVGKVGTVPIEKHELLAALSPQIALHAEDKVMSRDELVRRVALWRRNGERIVFTNGCFDLLHVGHIALIEQARRFGDRLIVAINSDASVSSLKGPSRPIVTESERARVLAALGAVDAIVIFGEPTPLEVVIATRPDVIVKGGDYTPETVVGAREVESWGGQLKIVPTVEGFSTTRLIEKGRGQ
jgi:D-beta-D-heptose 7-phosphate kinase/D-beta-D-heptose 1-phosphate adenosyltransferase